MRPLASVAAVLCCSLTALPTAAPPLNAARQPAVVDDFLCGTTSPDWRGRYRTLATAPAEGAALYYHQDPLFLTADYQGTVVLRDFTVAGDRKTMRIYYPTAGNVWAFEEFPRVTTRMVRGVFVSVFEPTFSMASLLDRANAGISVFWDNQGTVSTFTAAFDQTGPPGPLPAGAIPLSFRSAPKSFRPVAITKVSDTVQFSSHIVNLVVPGFGDGVAVDVDTSGIDLHEVARKFYETFSDSYDTLVAIPTARYLVNFGGFHRVVRNPIEGIGLPVYDDSRSFGSSGVLGGMEFLSVLNNVGVKHEQAHQWGDYFDWQRIGGVPGTSYGHSPRWADRETPLPGINWYLRVARAGNDWQTVRASFPHTFSPMMLYAMGRLPKEQVPDVFLFTNQSQQGFFNPGMTVQGPANQRSIFDVIGVHGERRGPVVGPTLSRANIVVSTRGLLSPQEMAVWTYYAQRIEDPNGTGVRGFSEDGSFERSTGVDLRTDIRPKSHPAIEGDRQVDDRPFSVDDVAGVKLEAEIPGRVRAGSQINLRGQVTAPLFTNSDTLIVDLRQYPAAPIVATQSYPIGASGRFDVSFQLPPDARGAYELRVSLTTSKRITRLAPLVVE